MAECKVFTECCTGHTNCDRKVTVGYLKDFIKDNNGNVLLKDANGNDITVGGTKGDAYELTYAELTGGTYLPIAFDAGANRASSNIDGITVNGSYSDNETVLLSDLILSYNRHKSLTVSGGKTFDKCGDSTNICATWILEKTVKSISVCEPLTYSYSTSDVYDTQCMMDFSVCSWLTIVNYSNNCLTVSAEQNGTGHSSTRSCNVTASLTYKGATRSSSNSAAISQPGVTGQWHHDNTSYDGVTAYTYDNRQYDCNGGSFTVSGTGEYTYHYYWVDDCNNSYYGEVSANTFTEELTPISDSFPACPDADGGGVKTLTITYHGLSDFITFTQVCSCEACSDFVTYGSGNGTATCDECGGEITVYATVSATIHHKDFVDGECVETGTTPTSYTQSITVTIPENTTQGGEGCTTAYTGSKTTAEGGTINYTITQSCENPCGGCQGETITRVWTPTSTTINACDTSATVAISGTETKSYSNCPDISYPVLTSVTFDNISTNETNNATSYTRTFEDTTVTIYQNAGPCAGCTGDTATTVWNNVSDTANACDTSKTVTITGTITHNYGNCDPETEPTSTPYVCSFSQNTGTTERTLTFYYPNQSAAGHATITITQPGGCACANPTATTVWNDVTTTAEACDTSKIVTITGTKTTKYSNCADNVESVSTTETYTFSQNTGSTSVTHTFTYNGATITISQAGGCPCNQTASTTVWNDVTTTAEACDTSKVVTITGTKTTKYSNCSDKVESVSATETYTFNQNTGSTAVTHTFTYNGATVTITQSGGCACANPTATTVWNNVSDTANACDTSKTVTITGTKTTKYSNCADKVESVSTTQTYTFSQNTGSTTATHTFTYNGATITINQEAGCTCNQTASTTVWNDVTTTAEACDTGKTVTINGTKTTKYSNCADKVESVSATETYTFSQNTGSTAVTHTFTYNGATITINQASGCPCANPTVSIVWNDVTTTAEACDTGKTVSVRGTRTTSYSNCADMVDSIVELFTVTFSENNTNVATAYTFYYPDSTSAGRATVTVNQAAGPCNCGIQSVVTTYDDVLIKVLKCDTSAIVSIPYTSVTTYTNSFCPPVTATGETNVTYTFGQNYTTQDVEHFYYYPADKPNGYATILIVQESGPCPCDATSTEYTVSSVTCDCHEHAANSIDIPYSATTHYSNCEDSSIFGIYPHPNAIPCNNTTSTRVFNGTYQGQPYTITQAAGDCCVPEPECDCQSSMTSSTDRPIEFSWDDIRQSGVATSANPNAYLVTVTYDTDCIEYVSNNLVDSYNFDCISEDDENGTFRAWIVPAFQNTSSSNKETTLDIIGHPYDRGSEEYLCHITLSIVQSYKPNECAEKTCSELQLTGITTTISKDAHTNYIIGNFTKTSCVSDITVNRTGNWLSVSVDETTGRVLGTMSAQLCGTPNRTATVTLTWAVGSLDNCSESWTVTQAGDITPCTPPCQCSYFSANTSNITFNSNGTLTNGSNYIITTLCDGTYELDYDSNKIVDAYLQNGVLYATAITNSSYSTNITGTIEVLLDSSTCYTWSYTIQKQSCVCADLSSVNTGTINVPSTGASRFVVWYVNADSCGSLSATSGSCDALFTSVGTGTSGSYYVVSATVSSNTAENDKTCNIGYVYGVKNGTSCVTDSTIVTVAGTGACDCTSSNIQLSGRTDIPAAGGSDIIIGSYTANCTNGLTFVTNSTYVSMVYGGNDGYVYGTVTANFNNSSRTLSLYARYNGTSCGNTVYPSQNGCNCSESNLYVDTSTVYVGNEGDTDYRSFSNDCGSVSASASNSSWLTAYTSGVYVYITAYENTSSSPRTGYVRVYLDGYSATCYSSITVSQDAFVCSCESCDLQLEGKSDIPMNGGNTTIGYFSASCTNGLSFIAGSNVSSVGSGTTGSSFGYTTGTVTGNVSTYSGQSSRSVTFGVRINGETCSTSGTGTQTGECTCSNSSFDVDNQTHYVASGNDSYTDIAYTSNCGSVYCVIVSDTGNCISTISKYNGYFRVYVYSNTTTSQKTATVRVYHCNDSNNCSSGNCYENVTVIQYAGQAPCQCSSFAITNAPYSATCRSSSSANSVTVASFTGNCGSITSVTSSNTSLIDNLTYDSTGSGYIYGNIHTNCGAARQATITVKYTANGSSCTNKTFVVKQCSGSISISPANGTASSCSGGTVTFTAS